MKMRSTGEQNQMKQMLAAAAVFCAINAGAAEFALAPEAAGLSAQASAQKAQPQAAAFFSAPNQSLFPMIAKRVTPLEAPRDQAQGQDCDGRTPDGLPLGCGVVLTPTGETTEDGIPLLSVPLDASVPHYGDSGEATLTFAVGPDGKTVGAVYELCAVIGPNDAGTRCSALEFVFDQLTYNASDRTIRAGNDIVAQYRDAKHWVFPLYLFLDSHGKGWATAKGLSLVSNWVDQDSAEPSLEVKIVSSRSK